MTSPAVSYHGYRLPPEVISHAVWLYHRFCLSFRDTEGLLQPRRDRRAAERFFRQVSEGQGGAPRRLITDRLRSYSAAHAIVPRDVRLGGPGTRTGAG